MYEIKLHTAAGAITQYLVSNTHIFSSFQCLRLLNAKE